MNFIVGLMVVVYVVESRSADLPSHFKKCSRSRVPNFAECISDAVTDAVISMADGLKSFKILPIEPLAVNTVSIGDRGGVVSIRQDYKNVKVHGLTKGLKVIYEPFGTESLILRSTVYNDQVDFVGDYVMNGKILLLPITGNGRANITLLGLKSENAIHCQHYDQDGETYLNVTKYEIKMSPKKVIFSFTNLFNGDPLLSTQMNKFLNENSALVFKETQGPFEETFGLVFTSIANNIFSRVSINKMFPE